jgi:sulfur carrier protein
MSRKSKMVQINLNGADIEILSDTFTIAALVAIRGLGKARVAVELNGAIVPKSLHGATVIKNADKIEIVIAVGGG